ncbi:hypothetical protein ACH4S8_39795 [Streptomyces sp. NPDC021080]|uniref:hypothetical protein n=1 Tax=Streptomyces sp. NPDC021080 TaxID=3365110 RepID=UPI00379AC713
MAGDVTPPSADTRETEAAPELRSGFETQLDAYALRGDVAGIRRLLLTRANAGRPEMLQELAGLYADDEKANEWSQMLLFGLDHSGKAAAPWYDNPYPAGDTPHDRALRARRNYQPEWLKELSRHVSRSWGTSC